MKPSCSITQADYREFLAGLEPDSVDLVLTDPPYEISRDLNFAFGKKQKGTWYGYHMAFGEWDKEVDLIELVDGCYKALRRGGTAIIWYDLWKFNKLADAMRAAKFKQLRFIEWIKDNPWPLNSRVNYLSVGREIAVVGVKGGQPTFNSRYDRGIYRFPMPPTPRLHTAQKSMPLFQELVIKHSNAGDLVVDPFLGSGTTALASVIGGRRFLGCDQEQDYVDIATQRLKEYRTQQAMHFHDHERDEQ